jgi:hypothetical protein
MKVPFFDKRIVHQLFGVLSTIISSTSSIVLFFVGIDAKCKLVIVIAVLVLFIFIYLGIWLCANMRRSITLKINTSDVEVRFGDIFKEQADLKVIGFNEYFDTLVDNKVISANSLNGRYIESSYKDNVAELDALISADTHLQEAFLEKNASRTQGKKLKYKLGTICVANNYLLTALSHFNDNNNAYLEINDYINCMLNFWNEVNSVYAGRTVALPILGSGITRFKEGNEDITDQELLELIIWTFKVSHRKFAYPSKIKIVVYEKKSERINLLRLKDLENRDARQKKSANNRVNRLFTGFFK